MTNESFDILPCEECEHSSHKKCAYREDCYRDVEMGYGLKHFEGKK